jgi:Trk K+ transport system NAD-binding subunit
VKFIASELAYFLRGRARQNLRVLFIYIAFLIALVFTYAFLFTILMRELEGRDYSLIAGLYWTVTAMTTLGYGDITFNSDPGFLFSVIVTLSGVIFLLIVLPFGIISLFLAPWIESRMRYRPTLQVPETMHGHVLICGIDVVTRAFIRKLRERSIDFYLVTPDYEQALRLEEDEALPVVLGDPSDAEVLKKLRVASARLLVANLGDMTNTNLVLTARALCAVPIVALAEASENAEFLRLAGANHCIPLKKILGRHLALRATTRGALAHVIDSFGPLKVAEIPVFGTPFLGMTLAQAGIRERTGLAVVGIWERGSFAVPTATTVLADKAVMVVVGTRQHLQSFQQLTGENPQEDFVLILGHGRIGCAAASFLERKPVPFVLVDRQPNPACEEHVAVIGDATSRGVLKGVGLERAYGVIVTTNDDGANIFLTLAVRHQHPHIRIVARANREEDVEQLYAAGADFVVSNASIGVGILLNVLEDKETIFLSEGVHVFRAHVPDAMAGKTLRDSQLRTLTGCSVIALERPDAEPPSLMPGPSTVLEPGMNMILIGSPQQESLCRERLR